MRAVRIDDARLEAFALAYVPAVLAAAKQLQPWRPANMPMEEWAVAVVIDMVECIKRGGVESVAHYVLNAHAFPAVCAELALPVSVEALGDYIGGR